MKFVQLELLRNQSVREIPDIQAVVKTMGRQQVPSAEMMQANSHIVLLKSIFQEK